MGKTKTQAQKRQEREERNKQNEIERNEKREAIALRFKNQQEVVCNDSAQTPMLTKKELRQQNKERKQQALLKIKETSLAEKPSMLSIDENPEKEELSSHATIQKILKETTEKAIQDVEAEKKEASPYAPARTIQHHTRYCEGLRPVLTRLEAALSGCTIITGEITSGKKGKWEIFTLTFQRMIDDNTYKFVARRGHTAQDVLITVPDKNRFNLDLLRESIQGAIEKKSLERQDTTLEEDISLSNYNRITAENRQNNWRESHEAKHLQLKNQEREIKEQKRVEEQRRKLKTKNIPSDSLEAYAKRDVRIISGEERGKYSM